MLFNSLDFAIFLPIVFVLLPAPYPPKTLGANKASIVWNEY